MTPPRWQVPFVRPDLPAFAAVAADIEAAFASGMLTKGPALERLEAAAADVLGVRHVVGVSSCTVGLALLLRALADVAARSTAGCGTPRSCPLPPTARRPAAGRREVILPSFNFLAAPAAIEWAGLEPVFVEVDPETFTMDPAATAAAVTPHTAAIMACHTFGCPCDEEALAAVAERAGVPLVVDAAHGLGTRAHGRQVGAAGLAQVFSLSPTKLVVAGEGGLVATNCDCLADMLRVTREYGNDGRYGCQVSGLNGRLPEISAIVARASLARLPEVTARRRAVAAAYIESLAGVPGIGFQRIPAWAESNWKDFSISVEAARAGIDRDGLRARLAAAGIDTRAYYDPPCHRMEAFARYLPADRELPVTDRLSASLLALPMGSHVPPEVARRVAAAIRAAVPGARDVAGATRVPASPSVAS